MRHASLLSRLGAAALALALLLLPAQALTPAQAGELLAAHYVDPVPQEVLDQPTVSAMLEALGDPYTEYLTAQDRAAFLDSMADYSMVGIGVVSTRQTDGFLLTEVLENSPAAQGGLQAGDLLVEVDGTALVGLSLDEFTALVQGTEGTQVALTYLRQGLRHTVTLTRATVVIPATSGEVLEGGVGYISCDTWGDETLGHFQTLMEEMEDQVGCWLIDLRYNTGGVTQAAVDVAGLFCDDPFVALRFRADSPDGYAYQFYQTEIQPITGKPAVLLVNGETASASELFSLILREYGVGFLVGSRTYGKGVGQSIWDQTTDPDYFPDGDALKITIARAYSPLGNTADGMGLIPQFLTADEDAPQAALELAHALIQAQADGRSWATTAQQLVTADIWQGCDFSDVQDSPFLDDIASLAAHDLLHGKGDGLFHPEDTLTRGELAQMLQNVLCRVPVTGSAVFDDVAADAWYASAAETVSRTGLMDGVGQGLFAPDRVLTHQELFAVLGRLGRRLNDDLDLAVRTMEDWQRELSPLKNYADWAKDPVWLLSLGMDDGEGGLVNLLWDDPEYIDPTAPATREETAAVLGSLLYYLGLLP